MTNITGGLTFGLLFALPAWYVLEDRASVGFVGLVYLTTRSARLHRLEPL